MTADLAVAALRSAGFVRVRLPGYRAISEREERLEVLRVLADVGEVHFDVERDSVVEDPHFLERVERVGLVDSDGRVVAVAYKDIRRALAEEERVRRYRER